MAKKLSKREKLLGLLEMSHKSLREMKDEDLNPPQEPEPDPEPEPEEAKPEEPDFLTRAFDWLNGD